MGWTFDASASAGTGTEVTSGVVTLIVIAGEVLRGVRDSHFSEVFSSCLCQLVDNA